MGTRVDIDKIEVAEVIETAIAHKKESSIRLIIEIRIASSIIKLRIEAEKGVKHLRTRMDLANRP